MFNSAIFHPYLELLSPSQYELLVHSIFEAVRHIPLCRLAAEELEVYFTATSQLRDDLYFQTGGTTICICLRHTDRIIAKIHFCEDL